MSKEKITVEQKISKMKPPSMPKCKLAKQETPRNEQIKKIYIKKCIGMIDCLAGKKALSMVEWQIWKYGEDFLNTLDEKAIKEIYRTIKKKMAIKK